MSRWMALTHAPSPQMDAGQRTHIPFVPIDNELALQQFDAYCRALKSAGGEVRTLHVYRHLPDCAFIEDTAVVLDELIVLAAMGADSRRDEPAGIEPTLREFRTIVPLQPPATLEGGDVLRIHRTLFVGTSGRTNAAGIHALAEIVRPYRYRVVPVGVRGCLHLKTACTLLPDDSLLVNPDWLDTSSLAGFELRAIPAGEPWGANVVLAGTSVVMAAAHERTAALLDKSGFHVRSVDLSEFAKAEAGATCLSLLITR